MAASFYTYFHTRNDTNAVFYVGKGKGERAYQNGRNVHWASVVKKCGYAVHVASRWSTEQEAFEHEKFLILCFRDIGMPLTNMTEGGFGGETVTGRKWMTKDKVDKMIDQKNWASHTTAGWVFGHSFKTSPHLGDLTRGVPKTADQKQRIRQTLFGRKLPMAHIEAISTGQLGRKHSTLWNKAISDGLKGLVKTKSHCAALSAAKKGKAVVNDGLVEKRVSLSELDTLVSSGLWKRGFLVAQCPTCKKAGGKSQMIRFHFANCKGII